jgi:hypothetical protein
MRREEIDELVEMHKKMARKQRWLFNDTSDTFPAPIQEVPSSHKLMEIARLTNSSINRLNVCGIAVLTVKYNGVEFQAQGKEVD